MDPWAAGIRNRKVVKPALFDEVLGDGKAYQFGIARQVEFFEEARSVSADGFHTEEQLVGNLRDGFTARDFAQDQVLAVG